MLEETVTIGTLLRHFQAEFPTRMTCFYLKKKVEGKKAICVKYSLAWRADGQRESFVRQRKRKQRWLAPWSLSMNKEVNSFQADRSTCREESSFSLSNHRDSLSKRFPYESSASDENLLLSSVVAPAFLSRSNLQVLRAIWSKRRRRISLGLANVLARNPALVKHPYWCPERMLPIKVVCTTFVSSTKIRMNIIDKWSPPATQYRFHPVVSRRNLSSLKWRNKSTWNYCEIWHLHSSPSRISWPVWVSMFLTSLPKI